mgnify:CR=1 FL=1
MKNSCSQQLDSIGITSDKSDFEGLKGTDGQLAWHNLLEPPTLVDSFLAYPPLGFETVRLGTTVMDVPAIVSKFDLLTTLENPYRRILSSIPLLRRALRLRTLFIGTTVSEYCLYPPGLKPTELLGQIHDCLLTEGASLAIIKDIPQASPLLSYVENEAANSLFDACRMAGYILVTGQALAYIPLDFSQTEDLLMGMSRIHRKSIRRKLRSLNALTISEYHSGDSWLNNTEVISRLYSLYLNVYWQSEIHFDLLSKIFFRDLLQRREHKGIIFVYRYKNRIIGYNLCFIHAGNLIDKYIGFEYPIAREHNLYYVSWFYNMQYALDRGLRNYIAGWTDPEIKAFLGASFTHTYHAVYLRNPMLRWVLRRFQRYFEPDSYWSKPAVT